MAKTDLTNQRQVFVNEYVRSEDHLKADKKFFLRPIPVIENLLATFTNLNASVLSSQDTHLLH